MHAGGLTAGTRQSEDLLGAYPYGKSSDKMPAWGRRGAMRYLRFRVKHQKADAMQRRFLVHTARYRNGCLYYFFLSYGVERKTMI